VSILPAAASMSSSRDTNPGPSSTFPTPIDEIGVTSNVAAKSRASSKKKPSVVTRTQVKAGKGPGRLRPTQPVQEEKWDDHFNDPEAKLIIKSDDGVKFRASRWQLSQCSWVLPNRPRSLPHSQVCARTARSRIDWTDAALLYTQRLLRRDAHTPSTPR
jgi:hypothetical protein